MTATALGKYEVRGVLGRGAMGVVYRAWDPVLEREVALKTMDVAGRASGDEQTVRFLREARAAGRLHHPNIVTIHELGETESGPYIAMELMEGIDLRQLLKSGKLPPLDRRLRIVADVCRGLDYAHRAGIVHRDVKPANVFLLNGGGVKLLDFGVAKLASSDATRSGMLIGSIEYMSPEQVRAERNLDGRSDVFAAGVILYELLFGRTPFSGDHVGSTMMKILHQPPPGALRFDEMIGGRLSKVLSRALAKSRDERFADAGEMARELDAVGRELRGDRGREVGARLAEALVEQQLEPADDDGTVVDAPGSPDPPGASATPFGWRRPAMIAAVLALAAVFFLVAWRATEPGPTEGGGTLAVAEPASDDAEATGSVDESAPGPGSVAESAIEDGAPATGPSSTDASAAKSAAGPASPGSLAGDPGDSGRAIGEVETSPPRGPARVETPADAGPTRRAAGDDAGRTDPPAAVPVAPGRLALLVTPWARVTSIRELPDGTLHEAGQVTPAVLTLPAGRYRFELAHPSSVEPIVVEADVEPNADVTVRRALSTPGLLSWIEGRLAEESFVLEDR